MRIPLALLFLLAFPAWGQTQAPPPTATSIVAPALDKLRTSLGNLRVDKWKAPGEVKREAQSNIGSIQHDMDGSLPPLLAAADGAPGAVSKVLPAFRNVDALYDVLLRVVQTADLAAPDSDTQSLHGALASLEEARRNLGDAMETAAVTQEVQTSTLREKLAGQAAPSAPAKVVDDGAEPAPKPSRKKKHAAKPPQ